MLKVTNKNYCGTIAKIDRIVPIPGADKIVVAVVLGNTVVVQNTAQVNDIGVFFPVETQLSPKFCHVNNLYDHAELNADNTQKGYISEKRRVRCVTLRKVTSEGLFLSLKSLESFGYNGFNPGDEFNFIGEEEVCQKYIVQDPGTQNTKDPNKLKKIKANGVPRESRMVDDQFRLHIDTEQLKKNIGNIDPDMLISITSKMHGTSVIISKVLVKRRLSWLERIAKYFGCAVIEQEYGMIASSRNVIRNKYFKEDADPHSDKKESDDIYLNTAYQLEALIPNGYTLYGELVGFKSGGGWIQKGYHYGNEPGKHSLHIYRITVTDNKGSVIELSFPQIKEFCDKFGLNTVPLFYYGYAKNAFDIPVGDNWHSEFLQRLQISFNMNNQMCELNRKEVPAEGCVVRIEKMYNPKPYKLKNPRFLKRETELLDTGVIDMESAESIVEE